MSKRLLLVNADDFGLDHSVNEAVLIAHSEGILTCASWMPNGKAANEAVQIAKKLPTLGVGLHLTLIKEKPISPPTSVSLLLMPDGSLESNPIRAGLRYFFCKSLRYQLRQEIEAQFKAFEQTGLHLDHINGHLHLHMHPKIFHLILTGLSKRPTIPYFRLTYEPFFLNLRIGNRRRLLYKLSHAIIFSLLSSWVRPILKGNSIPHTNYVFGLLESGYINEDYILKLISHLPPGSSELYTHPTTNVPCHELQALTSKKVRTQIIKEGIKLVKGAEL